MRHALLALLLAGCASAPATYERGAAVRPTAPTHTPAGAGLPGERGWSKPQGQPLRPTLPLVHGPRASGLDTADPDTELRPLGVPLPDAARWNGAYEIFDRYCAAHGRHWLTLVRPEVLEPVRLASEAVRRCAAAKVAWLCLARWQRRQAEMGIRDPDADDKGAKANMLRHLQRVCTGETITPGVEALTEAVAEVMESVAARQ